jgi:uncharacterized repeat protein (TIGR03806 family)
VRRIALALGLWVALTAIMPRPMADDALIQSDALPPKLSAFRLGVTAGFPLGRALKPYTLNTPLFSDYAEKYRAIYVPDGAKIGHRAAGVLDFPVGSVLIKSFGYPADLRKPDEGVRIIETRLLIHRQSGWVALPYVWDKQGKDADLVRVGRRVPAEWIDLKGVKRSISYAIPNVNQCKDCHAQNRVLVPIGPTARNLALPDHMLGILGRSLNNVTPLPRWNDPATGTVAERARAYLDVNCAHCHSREGAASNSGLYLGYDEPVGATLGVGKRPVAAGHGSGAFSFGIEPGKPDQSIIVHRMNSLQPGVAMPELGRATVHDEGVALVSAWIAEMK